MNEVIVSGTGRSGHAKCLRGNTLLTSPRNPALALARDCVNAPDHEVTKSLDCQDASPVILPLRDLPVHEFRSDSRHERRDLYHSINFNIIDRNASSAYRIQGRFDHVQVYIARFALDDLADEENPAPIMLPRVRDGWNAPDPIVAGMQSCSATAAETSEEASQTLLNHLVLELHAHRASPCGGVPRRFGRSPVGVTHWQQSRTQELIAAHLHGGMSLEEADRDCRLSPPAHFSCNFEQTTGLTPYGWMQA